MKRIMMTVAYDGTNYHGWQIQPNGISIEQVLNEALSKLLGEEIKVSGASRTDTGVHALCNMAVFDTDTRIPGDKIAPAVNQRLPQDIRVIKSCQVENDFHPRFVKTEKTYEYKIYNAHVMDPSKRFNHLLNYYQLDLEAMERAARVLVGIHDFKSFCSVDAQVKDTVREITDISVTSYAVQPFVADMTGGEFATEAARIITIRVSGYGFLYNMVRIIAGTLLEIGRGAMDADRMSDILNGCDRMLAGPTAPAHGLTLTGYKILE